MPGNDKLFLTQKLVCLRKGEVIGEGNLRASPTRRCFPSPNFYLILNPKRFLTADLFRKMQLEAKTLKL